MLNGKTANYFVPPSGHLSIQTQRIMFVPMGRMIILIAIPAGKGRNFRQKKRTEGYPRPGEKVEVLKEKCARKQERQAS